MCQRTALSTTPTPSLLTHTHAGIYALCSVYDVTYTRTPTCGIRQQGQAAPRGAGSDNGCEVGWRRRVRVVLRESTGNMFVCLLLLLLLHVHVMSALVLRVEEAM